MNLKKNSKCEYTGNRYNFLSVSESLAHPDFSCVALYGQLVVGFAFLLPNVSHTEAYISFVFTHPEWRGAGIGKFLIYHLIQVRNKFK